MCRGHREEREGRQEVPLCDRADIDGGEQADLDDEECHVSESRRDERAQARIRVAAREHARRQRGERENGKTEAEHRDVERMPDDLPETLAGDRSALADGRVGAEDAPARQLAAGRNDDRRDEHDDQDGNRAQADERSQAAAIACRERVDRRPRRGRRGG